MTKKKCAFQMHFHITRTWVLRFLSRFFCPSCFSYSPNFLQWSENVFQKYRREQEENMQYTHHLRPCITFIIRKPRKKKNEKQAWEKKEKEPGLKGMNNVCIGQVLKGGGEMGRKEKKMVQREACCLSGPLSNC